MKKVFVMTLRGLSVKGEHIPAFEVVEMDEKDAGLCVGGNGAVFVANVEKAKAEAEKRKKAAAAAEAELNKSLGFGTDEPAKTGKTGK